MKRVFLENEVANPLNPQEVGTEWLFIPEEHIYGFRFYTAGSESVRVEIVVLPQGLSVAPTIFAAKCFRTLEEAQKWVREAFPNVCSSIIKKIEMPPTNPEPGKEIMWEG